MTQRTRRRTFAIQFNLTTLLMVTALCGSGIAYYVARTNRFELTSKMNTLGVLKGNPPVTDVSKYWSYCESLRDERMDVWVPRHGEMKLCWSTKLSDDNEVAMNAPIKLGEGRHRITVRVHKHEAVITVDDKVVFNQRFSERWNVAVPAEWSMDGDQQLSSERAVIMTAAGVATLGADEVFDPSVHRFGLKLWLEK